MGAGKPLSDDGKFPCPIVTCQTSKSKMGIRQLLWGPQLWVPLVLMYEETTHHPCSQLRGL